VAFSAYQIYLSYLLLQLYNSLWVLACSIISFHCFLSCVLCFQLVIPIFLKSFLTSSTHLTLGLPFSLVAYGFHLCMVLATLSLVILSTCPNQLSRLYFVYLTIFSLLIVFSSSSFVLSLHSPFAFCVGPNILFNIFLSNTNNFCLMFSVKTQHSDPYTATGLMRALYNFILVFLDINLFWSIFWFAKEARLPAAILTFISSSIKLSLVTVVPRYLFYSSIFIPSISISISFPLVCILEILVISPWFIDSDNGLYYLARTSFAWSYIDPSHPCLRGGCELAQAMTSETVFDLL